MFHWCPPTFNSEIFQPTVDVPFKSSISPKAHNHPQTKRTLGKNRTKIKQAKISISPALNANINSQWDDPDREVNHQEENTKAKSINHVATENIRGKWFAPFFRPLGLRNLWHFGVKKFSSRRHSYSSSDSDDSIDNHRRHSRSKRSRKLNEVERLTEVDRMRKLKDIEEKVRATRINNKD